jgi:EmrB/QacA subfamily drug resistance transporter
VSLILIAGSVSDRVGRVRALRIGLVVFGAAPLLCALAPAGGVLVAARLVQGCGGALLVPSSLALITSAFAGLPRARAVGAWTAWTSVAFIIGPPLGGVLVDTVGWRWVFAVNLIPVVATLVVMRGFTDGPVVGPVRIDITGAILVAVALGATVLALIQQPGLGWGSPFVIVGLVAGGVLIACFVWWESRTRNPLLPLSLFSSRNFGAGNMVTLWAYAGVGLGILIVTLYLQEVAHVPAAVAGLATLPVAVVSIALSQLFGKLSGKHGPRMFMTVGPLVSAAAFVFLAFTPPTGAGLWWHVLPGMAMYGLGLAIMVAPLTAAVLGSVPESNSGVASAFNNAVSRIAGLVAVALAGTVGGTVLGVTGFQRLSLLTAGFFAVGGLVAVIGIRNADAVPVSGEHAALCNDRPTPALHPGTTSTVAAEAVAHAHRVGR